MKKRLITTLSILFIPFLFLPTHVLAQQINNPISPGNLGELISRVSVVTTPLAIVGMIFSLIYGGFIKMTALGNAEKEAKSKAVWGAAFIGFLMIAFAPVLVRVIGSLLGIDVDILT